LPGSATTPATPQLVFSCTQENELHYLWSPTQCWQAAQLRSADSFTVSVLNEENWDARLVERFSLPLYGLPYRSPLPPPTKISAMPQRKHCLGSATPQRNIVFLISPTRAHACLISCSGRKKNIHSRCCLSTTNQPVRLFSMLFVTSSEESRRRRYSSSIQPPRNAWHPWHRVDLCVPLSPLPREGMELILQLPAICAQLAFR
jgi:hypothetical protein